MALFANLPSVRDKKWSLPFKSRDQLIIFDYDIYGMAPRKFRRDAWLLYFEFVRIDWKPSLFEAVSIFVSLLCKKKKKKPTHDLQIAT